MQIGSAPLGLYDVKYLSQQINISRDESFMMFYNHCAEQNKMHITIAVPLSNTQNNDTKSLEFMFYQTFLRDQIENPDSKFQSEMNCCGSYFEKFELRSDYALFTIQIAFVNEVVLDTVIKSVLTLIYQAKPERLTYTQLSQLVNLLHDFQEKQNAMQQLFKNYKGTNFTQQDLGSQVERLMQQFYKQHFVQSAFIIYVTGPIKSYEKQLSELLVKQALTYKLTKFQQQTKQLKIENLNGPQITILKSPRYNSSKNYISSCNVQVICVGCHIQNVFSSNLQKLLMHWVASSSGPLRWALKNIQTQTGDQVIPDHLLKMHIETEILEGQQLFTISINDIPEVYEEVIHSCIYDELKTCFGQVLPKNLVLQFIEFISNIQKGILHHQLVNDILPYILQEQVSTPHEIYGPTKFLDRGLMKRFTDFWPEQENLKDKPKFNFSNEKFIQQDKMTLFEYINFKSEGPGSSQIVTVQKMLKAKKTGEYWSEGKHIQLLAVIGARDRVILQIQKTVYEHVNFLKSAFKELVDCSQIVIQVVADTQFNPTTRICTLRAQLQQLNDQCNASGLNTSIDENQVENNDPSQTQAHVVDINAIKPFQTVLDHYEKARSGVNEFDYKRISLKPCYECKKTIMFCEQYAIGVEKSVSLNDIISKTTSQEVEAPSQQIKDGLTLLTCAQDLYLQSVKVSNLSDAKQHCEVMIKTMFDQMKKQFQLPNPQMFIVQKQLSPHMNSSVEFINEQADLTQMLLVFLKKNNTKTFIEFQKYLETQQLKMSEISLKDRFIYDLKLYFDLNFIPPELQQYIPYILFVLNKINDSINLRFDHGLLFIQFQGKSASEFKKQVRFFKRKIVQKQLTVDDLTCFVNNFRMVKDLITVVQSIQVAIWCGKLVNVKIDIEQLDAFDSHQYLYDIQNRILCLQCEDFFTNLKEMLIKLPLLNKKVDRLTEYTNTIIKSKKTVTQEHFIIKQSLPQPCSKQLAEVTKAYYEISLSQQTDIVNLKVEIDEAFEYLTTQFSSSIEGLVMIYSLLNVQNYHSLLWPKWKLAILNRVYFYYPNAQLTLEQLNSTLEQLPLQPESTQVFILTNNAYNSETVLKEMPNQTFSYFNGTQVSMSAFSVFNIIKVNYKSDTPPLKLINEVMEHQNKAWTQSMTQKLTSLRKSISQNSHVFSTVKQLKQQLQTEMKTLDGMHRTKCLLSENQFKELDQAYKDEISAKNLRNQRVQLQNKLIRNYDFAQLTFQTPIIKQESINVSQQNGVKTLEIAHFLELSSLFDISQKQGSPKINELPLMVSQRLEFKTDKQGFNYSDISQDTRFNEMPAEIQQLAQQGQIYVLETAILHTLLLQNYIANFLHTPLKHPLNAGGFHTMVTHLAASGTTVPVGLPIIHGSAEYTRDDEHRQRLYLLKSGDAIKIFNQPIKQIMPVAKDLLTFNQNYDMLLTLICENTAQLAVSMGITGDDPISVLRQIIMEKMTTRM
ncbi:Conserved_hypothetical protein [Hexamita inflata]|uniref:Uncharacterized protein n=1 Tax=Hexamita inflata TaxID=28002 RepID=A0AA86PRZ3_9EUKA|nr:Conserved hypothetical protein [Hexamita inflata]